MQLGSKLPTRRDDVLAKDHERALPMKGSTHHTLLCSEQPFVESSNPEKCRARAKQETSACQSQYPVERPQHRHKGAAIERQGAVESMGNCRHRAITDCPNADTDHGLVDHGVGIHENEYLASRLAGPGISSRGDLPVGNGDHPTPCSRAMATVRSLRLIIHNDDLKRMA